MNGRKEEKMPTGTEDKNSIPHPVIIAPDQHYGRWTVMNDVQKTAKGEKKWLCRCKCGTERYVLERSLKNGGSKSCGCMRKEAATEAIAHDLHGKTFGALTVIGRSGTAHTNGGVWWQCRCSCSKMVEYPGTILVTGRRTSCGCKTEKHYYTVDIAGQTFGRLTALHPMQERDERGSVIWHCRCECGNEVDVAYNRLLYTSQQSCGCLKLEQNKKITSYLSYVDGTSIDHISSRKLPADNTTGVKGVYLIHGKYVAKIVFQKKAYYLGTYSKIEDAAEARKRAENELFNSTVEYYAQWKKKAEESAEWAEHNPVRISVKSENGNLRISFEPQL